MLCICQKIFLLIFGINYIYTQVTKKYGYCTYKRDLKLTNGTATIEDSFCCRHYEERNNECKECKTGYTSEKGMPCQPCALGTYGKKCAFTCECQENQRCHHENGCIALYILAEVTTSTSDNKENDKRTVAGMNVREIIVCSVGAGVFVFVILLCTVYQRRNKSYKTESRRGINKPDTSSPDVPLEDIEGIYEQIDESNMIDNHANVGFSRSTVLGTSQSYCQRNCNVYLTSHQSCGEGLNSNNFNGNKSGSEKQMTESGNLNPYQPIMISVRDSHEYESLHGC